MNTLCSQPIVLCRGIIERFCGRSKWHTSFALSMAAVVAATMTASAELNYVKQGDDWDNVARNDFYTRDQGSQLIKYKWFKALKHADGQPLLADQLGRYGYLPNPGNPDGLPIGFTKGGDFVGMNCAACHTRQIQVSGQEYRIDGGPALVDAQGMFVALDKAAASVLATDANFLAFAKEVLGQPNPDPDDVVLLKAEVQAWFLRYDTLIQRGMPTQPWGPGRLDAVGMIFNRLTGLDIGPPPSFLIADNIKRADAPVRYPFLWNASRQDMTQWPGFAKNGSDSLALSRNLGEVYGVFANFEPKKEWWHPLGINYLRNNSANFDGLGRLEQLIKKIGPPKYPWPIDPVLSAQGKTIYERKGSCAECHRIEPGETRFPNNATWKTRIMDVGTDTHEYDIMEWTSKTGVLEGKGIPLIFPKLKAVDSAFSILSISVAGSIIQHAVPLLTADAGNFEDKVKSEVQPQLDAFLAKATSNFKLPSDLKDLEGSFDKTVKRVSSIPDSVLKLKKELEPATTTKFAYESRVMEGIWAAAPYLHNGSVPTLADLLEKREKRTPSFKIGPNYDIERLGMAKDQTKFGDQTLTTSADRNSGSYNGGHEFGTDLSVEEKKALLEYLKEL